MKSLLKRFQNNEFFFKSRLARRHLLYVLACSAFFTFLAVLFQLYMDYREDKSEIEGTFSIIEQSYLPPIASSWFFFETEQLKLLLKAIHILPGVEYAAIYKITGENEFPVESVGSADIKNSVQRDYTLVYRYQDVDRKLGVLRIVSSLDYVYQRLENRVLIIIGTNTIKTFLVSFFILAIVHFLTIRHLKQIFNYVGKIDLTSNKNELLSLNRKSKSTDRIDELDEIVSAINSMYSRQINSYQELERTESQLKITLKEKETLLQELYHRTKNNMQVIRSLLRQNAMSYYEKSDDIREIVKSTDNSIQAMSLVHEMLYQSKNLSNIDAHDFVNRLAELVLQSFSVSNERISIVIDIKKIPLIIDTAMPLGLLLNELISNSLKYAFPGDRNGVIRIFLDRKSSGELSLKVSDNGIGVPDTFDIRKQKTFGCRIIVGIVENQLNGSLNVKTSQGLAYDIEFNDNLYSERV